MDDKPSLEGRLKVAIAVCEGMRPAWHSYDAARGHNRHLGESTDIVIYVGDMGGGGEGMRPSLLAHA